MSGSHSMQSYPCLSGQMFGYRPFSSDRPHLHCNCAKRSLSFLSFDRTLPCRHSTKRALSLRSFDRSHLRDNRTKGSLSPCLIKHSHPCIQGTNCSLSACLRRSHLSPFSGQNAVHLISQTKCSVSNASQQTTRCPLVFLNPSSGQL